MNADIPGGWSEWHFAIDETTKKLFHDALHLVGVAYHGLAVATQVVHGTNYCFLAKAQGTYPKAPERAVLIYIFEPLPGEGKPHMTRMHEIRPDR